MNSTSNSEQMSIGSVVGLWRYPVKSMMGEELNASEVTSRGLLGDRAYGVVDNTDGKVATAKNPRKWPRLFDCRAAFADPPRSGAGLTPIRITLPDGAMVTSDHGDRDQILSQALEREVTLGVAGSDQQGATSSVSEEYWPDIEGLEYRDTVTDFELPEGSFFDIGVVHLLATATLNRLRELHPQGRFEARRFRPNVVVETTNGANGFVENEWVGRTLAIGDEVRLHVTKPCSRCVMTTLAQGDLPKDVEILRTAAKHNEVHVGVYACVVRTGVVRRGDNVSYE